MRNCKADTEPRFPKAAGTLHVACIQWMTWITNKQKEEEQTRERRKRRHHQLRNGIQMVIEQVRQQKWCVNGYNNEAMKCAHARGARTWRCAETIRRRDVTKPASVKSHEKYAMHPFAQTDKFGRYAWATLAEMAGNTT